MFVSVFVCLCVCLFVCLFVGVCLFVVMVACVVVCLFVCIYVCSCGCLCYACLCSCVRAFTLGELSGRKYVFAFNCLGFSPVDTGVALCVFHGFRASPAHRLARTPPKQQHQYCIYFWSPFGQTTAPSALLASLNGVLTAYKPQGALPRARPSHLGVFHVAGTDYRPGTPGVYAGTAYRHRRSDSPGSGHRRGTRHRSGTVPDCLDTILLQTNRHTNNHTHTTTLIAT